MTIRITFKEAEILVKLIDNKRLSQEEYKIISTFSRDLKFEIKKENSKPNIYNI